MIAFAFQGKIKQLLWQEPKEIMHFYSKYKDRNPRTIKNSEIYSKDYQFQ